MATFSGCDGVRLCYETEGTGSGLVLHLGAGCDASLWRAAGYVAPLSQIYRCVLFDHRGHGPSDHPRGAAANHIDRYAEDVLALVDDLTDSKVAFFGWSNAVLVGLRAAEQHPEIFDALVLFGPIAPPATTEQLERAVESRLRELRARGWWYLLDAMIAAEPDPVPQWMIDRILATDIEPYIDWSEARPAWDWSPWDALAKIDLPTLMVVGELEDPDDLMGQAASTMPNATRIRIPGREHINAFLASDLVLPPVTRFLAEAIAETTRP
jgi:pimeloyl-ACP methyl ester carboxylesterase